MPANSVTKTDVIEVFESDQKNILHSVETILKIVTQNKNNSVSTTHINQQIIEANDRLQDMKHKSLDLFEKVETIFEEVETLKGAVEDVPEKVQSELDEIANDLKNYMTDEIERINESVAKKLAYFKIEIIKEMKKSFDESLRPFREEALGLRKRLRPSEREEIEEFSEEEQTVKRSKLTLSKN